MSTVSRSSPDRRRPATVAASLLFVLVAGALTFTLSQQPFHNWDMIPYIACALEWEGEEEVHAETYRIIQEELPQKTFNVLTTGEYRERCYRDAAFFQSRLPFYRVKPLYTSTIMVGRLIGLPYTVAVRFVPLSAYFAIALLLWFGLGGLLPPLRRFILSLLVVAIYPVTELARLSTPDGPAVFFLLCVFLMIYRGTYRLSVLWFLSLLAVATRLDYAIYAIVIFTSLRFLPPFRRESNVTTGRYIALLASIIAALLLIGPAVGNGFDWWFAFDHAGSGSGYLRLIKESLSFFNMTWVMVLLVIGAIALPLVRRFGTTERERGMFLLILGSAVLRLLLFPSVQERFFIAHYLMLLVVGIGWVERIVRERGRDQVAPSEYSVEAG